jgi:hypothetical protein
MFLLFLKLKQWQKNYITFYQNSPKRLKELGRVAAMLQTNILNFKYLHSVRWVSNRVGALTAIVNNYSAVVMHLKEMGNGNGDEDATSKGLLKKMNLYFGILGWLYSKHTQSPSPPQTNKNLTARHVSV